MVALLVVGAMGARASADVDDEDDDETGAYEEATQAEKRADPFEDVGMMFDKANWPTQAVWRPIMFPRSMIQITGTLEANLSVDATFEPFSLAPDIYYGVNEKLTVGVIHSSSAFGSYGAGNGICLSGADGGCPDTYRSVGFDGLYGLMDDKIEVAAHGGIDILSVPDPMLVSLRMGVKARWNNTKIQVVCDPHIRFGITERDFNDDAIGIPVQANYQATSKLAAGAHTGLFGPLDGLGDALRIPFGLQALYGLSHKVDIGGALSFINVFGTDGSADARVLNVFASYRL